MVIIRVFLKLGIIAFLLLPFSLRAQDGATYQSASNLLDYSFSRFEAGNFDKAIEYGLKGLGQAEEIQDDALSLQFKSILGNSYLSKRQYKTAADYFLQIAFLAKQENNNAIAANGYLALAKVYVEMGAFKKSAETYLTAADFFNQSADKQGWVDATTAAAFNYKFAKEYNLSENYFKQLIGESKDDAFYVASCHEQLAFIYEEREQYNEAINSSLAVFNYNNRLNNREGQRKAAQYTRKLGDLYAKAGNGSRALDFAQRAVSAAPTNIESNRILGDAYIASQDYSKAISTLGQTVNLVIASPKNPQKALVYKSLAKAYHLSGNGSKALEEVKNADAAATSQNLTDEKEEIYSLGVEIASAIGDNGEAGRFNAELTKATQANRRLKNKEKSDLKRKDDIARKNEDELTLKIAQQFSSDFVSRSQQLSADRGRQERELLSKSLELTTTQEENEELLRLQDFQDSVLEVAQRRAEQANAQAEGFRSLADSASSSAVAAMNEVEAKQKLLETEQELRQTEGRRADQQRIALVVVIGSIVIVLIIILYAFYKTNQSRKIIKEQNQNLEEQQNTIKKRNLQLKKSSDHLLKSNNSLKKVQASLKSSLSKEQEMRTELESINSELKNTQVQLIHAEKMSSLGQLTAGIAHEINNPINFVLNSANIIGMNFEELKEIFQVFLQEKDGEKMVAFNQSLDQEEIADSIDIIEEMLGNLKYGADRVTEIVKGLRTFSRFDEAEIKTVDIHENLESSLLILHNKYSDHNIAISKSFDDTLPEIECYPGQLNQVFVNIVNNAIDVISEVESPEIKIGTSYQDEHIVITIEDNGTGIPDDVKEKIFDPFFTTKDVGKGTGLGLSISHSIIQQHNGQILVDSKVGEGTKFTIILPKDLYSSTEKQQAVAAN